MLLWSGGIIACSTNKNIAGIQWEVHCQIVVAIVRKAIRMLLKLDVSLRHQKSPIAAIKS